MIVNGQTVDVAEGLTLQQFLVDQNYNPEHVAVECNGEIIPRAQFGECLLSENDKLEIVCFVGGG